MKEFKKLFITLTVLLVVVLSVGCSNAEKKPIDQTPKQEKETTQASSPAPAPKSEDSGVNLKGLLDKSKAIDNYAWECQVTMEGVSSGYKYWVKGKKQKMEMGDGADGMVIYIDGDKNITYMYDKQQKSAMAVKNEPSTDNAIKPDEFLNSISKGDLSGYKKKGKQNVEGMDCTLYEYTFMDQTAKLYVWDKYEVVVKMEAEVKGKILSSYLLKNYQVGTVTDEMVTIPKGTEIIELPS